MPPQAKKPGTTESKRITSKRVIQDNASQRGECEPATGPPKFKRSTPPNCEKCGVTVVNVSTPGEISYWRCPSKGCGWTSKTKRELVVRVPVCPNHEEDVKCRLDKSRGDNFMTVFVCPEPDCHYVESVAKPGLSHESIAQAESDSAGVSAR